VKFGRDIAKVNANHTVFFLAYGTAVLTLHTGGFVTFLDKTGFVNDSDTVLMAVAAGDVLLQPVPDSELVPAEQTQELLQISWGYPDSISHRFDAFPLQITQLPLDVEVEVTTGGDTPETVVKLMQKSGQLRFDPQNRVGVHAEYLQIIRLSAGYYRLAA